MVPQLIYIVNILTQYLSKIIVPKITEIGVSLRMKVIFIWRFQKASWTWGLNIKQHPKATSKSFPQLKGLLNLFLVCVCVCVHARLSVHDDYQISVLQAKLLTITVVKQFPSWISSLFPRDHSLMYVLVSRDMTKPIKRQGD